MPEPTSEMVVSQNQEIAKQVFESTRREFIEGIISEFYSCTINITKEAENPNAFFRFGEYTIIIENRLPNALRRCPICGTIKEDVSGKSFYSCNHEGTSFKDEPPALTEWVAWDPILTDEGILKMLGSISENMNANLVAGNYSDIDLKKIALKIAANVFAEVFVIGEDRYVRKKDRIPTKEEFTRWILSLCMNIYSVITKGDKMRFLDETLKATERKEEIRVLPEEEKKRRESFWPFG